MSHPAISASGLRKSFGGTAVLDDIDLTVPPGSVFALLGPNGAGKTTTVNILTTLISPDAGNAQVAGHDLAAAPDAVRAAIGVTGQFSAVDNLLTGRENLLLMAALHHLPRREGRHRAAELIDRLALGDAAGRAASTYSGGMRRRLDLAMTLIGRPQVIFLDEPTTGLDPRSRRETWGIVRDLVADGVAVFLTTQYLEEADHLADQVAVLDRGRIVAEGTPHELKRSMPGAHVRLQFGEASSFAVAHRLLTTSTPDTGGLVLRVPSDGSLGSLRELLAQLDRAAVDVVDLSVHTPDLDDVFLALTAEKVTAP